MFGMTNAEALFGFEGRIDCRQTLLAFRRSPCPHHLATSSWQPAPRARQRIASVHWRHKEDSPNRPCSRCFSTRCWRRGMTALRPLSPIRLMSTTPRTASLFACDPVIAHSSMREHVVVA